MLLFRKEFHTEEEMRSQVELFRSEGENPFLEESSPIREKDINLITDKCGKILEKIPEIDGMLSDNTENWSISRIGKTELTILRLAVYEIVYDDTIPVGVAINEAVELSKSFCQDGASSFVNGILAKFAKDNGGEASTKQADGQDAGQELKGNKAQMAKSDETPEETLQSTPKALTKNNQKNTPKNSAKEGGATVIVVGKRQDS